MASTINSVNLIDAYAQLFRLPVGIVAALAGCASVYALKPTLPFHYYFLTAAVLALMYSGACAINDYWDVEKDRIDHPERPLPSGRLSLRQAWWSAVVLFAGALISAIPLGMYPVVLVAVSIGLLWNYSHLLLYSGILGNFIVATIISALIFLGSLVARQPGAMLYPTGFLFIYTLAKEVIWDVHDAEGDRSQGILTVANQWGDKTAFGIAWGLIGLLFGSMPIALLWLPMAHPWVFVGFSALMLLCLSTALAHYQRQRSNNTYQSLVFWERLGMLFGVLGLLGTAPVLSPL
jgi:geranylgeranylglycerol-phosphate geranylgeranyltransferase